MSWLYLRDDCVLISRSWNLHHIMIKNIIMGVTIKVMLVSTSWNKSSFRWQMRTMEDYEKDRQDINVEIWSKTVCIPCSPRFPPRPAPFILFKQKRFNYVWTFFQVTSARCWWDHIIDVIKNLWCMVYPNLINVTLL